MSLTLVGPTLLTPGKTATLFVHGTPDLANWDRIYLPTFGIPPGFSLTYSEGSIAQPNPDPTLNVPWTSIGWQGIWVNITPDPKLVAPGNYQLPITFNISSPDLRSAGTNYAPQNFTYKCQVQAVPGLPGVHIPNQNVWVSKYKQLTSKWVPQIMTYPKNSLGFDNWYYDITRVLLQYDEFFRTPGKSLPAALVSAQAYSDYVTPNNGQIQGWDVFPKGLRMLWQQTQDSKWLTVFKLLQNASYVQSGGHPDPAYIRETAYALSYWMENEWTGAARDSRLYQCASYLMGHIDMLLRQELGKDRVTNPGFDPSMFPVPCQPFFFGLAMEYLIEYYYLTNDTRVVQSVQTACDYIWKNGVQPDGSTLYDMWLPPSDPNNALYCSLNLMFAPAFAWLFRMGRGVNYRSQGDVLFGAFNGREGVDFSAKVWAQNYRLSPMYIRWRDPLLLPQPLP